MSEVVVGVAQTPTLGLPDQSDDGQRRPGVVPGAICSQFSLTEEFEKILLVSEDG
jgi:hypothetical protein